MRTSITRAGLSVSAIDVNPRRSENMTVPSRWIPPKRRPSELASTSSTTSSGTNRVNRSRVRMRSKASVTSCVVSVPAVARINAPSGYTKVRIVPELNANWTPTVNATPSPTASRIVISGRARMPTNGTVRPSSRIST